MLLLKVLFFILSSCATALPMNAAAVEEAIEPEINSFNAFYNNMIRPATGASTVGKSPDPVHPMLKLMTATPPSDVDAALGTTSASEDEALFVVSFGNEDTKIDDNILKTGMLWGKYGKNGEFLRSEKQLKFNIEYLAILRRYSREVNSLRSTLTGSEEDQALLQKASAALVTFKKSLYRLMEQQKIRSIVTAHSNDFDRYAEGAAEESKRLKADGYYVAEEKLGKPRLSTNVLDALKTVKADREAAQVAMNDLRLRTHTLHAQASALEP